MTVSEQSLEGRRWATVMPIVPEIAPSELPQHPLPDEEGVFDSPAELYPTTRFHRSLHIGGAKVEYIYEAPETVADEMPLLIVPGYVGAASSYGGYRHAIATSGKPAISMKVARTQHGGKGFHPNHFFNPAKVQSEAVYGVMKDASQHLRVDVPYDLSAHSWGGEGAVSAALEKPEYIRTVTLLGSVGLNGHRLPDMLPRVRDFICDELLPSLSQLRRENEASVALEALHYLFRNPLRTVREALAIANCDIRDKVTALGGFGIKTAAIQFAADPFFPLDSVQRESGKRVNEFYIYPDVEAGHLTPQLQPDKVAKAQLEVLQRLYPTIKVA